MQLDRCCVWLLVKKNSHIKIKLFHHQNPTVNKWALLQHRHGMVFLYCQYLLTSLAADKQCLPAQLIDLWERFLISNQKNTLMFAHIIVYVGQSEVRKIWVSYMWSLHTREVHDVELKKNWHTAQEYIQKLLEKNFIN